MGGATGSEALNAELKHWFVGINHLHATIMKLKLRVFHLSKLLAFCSDMYDRTAAQIRQSVLLARVLENWKFALIGTSGVRNRMSTKCPPPPHEGEENAGRRTLGYVEEDQ